MPKPRPLKLPGKVVRGHPLKNLSPEERERLREGLRKIEECERQAWITSRECWIR